MNGELQAIEPCDVRHHSPVEPTGADRIAIFRALIDAPMWVKFPISDSTEWDTRAFGWSETNTAD